MVELPDNHPLRFTLSNEVHARPPEPLEAPVHLSGIAMTTNWPYRDSDRDVICDVASRYGATPPGVGAKHYSVDLSDFRLIWERHTEFTRYTFIVTGDRTPFAQPAIDAVPKDWLANLPGELIAASHASMIPAPDQISYSELGKAHFSDNTLIGAAIAGDAARALTDFRIHADGFSRYLILNKSMTPWHAGRIVQRLLEIETYRIMALLALPVAQDLVQKLTGWENELSKVTTAMSSPEDVDETELLTRLTALQASIEKSHTESDFRFGAASAYYSLVQRRIDELREVRLPEMQTFQEFTVRRLAPAMNTCASVASRQEGMSERVDRAAQLLSTRVDMSLEQQNQALLESMNRRAELQLRLQQTVEGLSLAAITYYTVGVIAYAAAGLAAIGFGVDPKLVAGISVPLVLAIAGFGLWRSRKSLSERDVAEES